MAVPSTMNAVVFRPMAGTMAVESIPTPSPGPRQILVQVKAVALNTVDVMNIDHPMAQQEFRVAGSDFAGRVVEAGAEVAGLDDPRVKVGARVAGLLQGANSENDRPGAFAEYLVADYDLTWSVPTSIDLEGAAGMNLTGLTAAQGLFYRIGFPCPFWETPSLDADEPVPVLIYGSTTNVALYMAQLVRLAAKSSGKKVLLIGAAKSASHSMLKAAPYNYDVLVDYKDPQWPAQVRDATGGKGVKISIDTVSVGKTVPAVESTLSPDGKFAAFRNPSTGGYDIAVLTIKPAVGAVWEGLGVEIGYHGATLPKNDKARAFAAAFFKYLTEQVPLSPVTVRLMSGGFQGIVTEGFNILRESGLVAGLGGQSNTAFRPLSAEKLVYRV